MKILLAVPCYNCEVQIKRLVEELAPILKKVLPILEVCIIDNISTDQSVKAALDAVALIDNSSIFSIYKNTENAGLGGTHKIAFSLATQKNYTHLMILHGDHQATPLDIPALIETSSKNSESTVLGSRFSNLDLLSGYSRVRTYGNRVLNWIYSIFTGYPVNDLGSGLNLFKLDDFEKEKFQNFDNGFTFNMDLLLYLIRNKKKFLYVPIHWSTSDQISNARALSVGIKTLKKLFIWKLGIEPKNRSFDKTNKVEKI